MEKTDISKYWRGCGTNEENQMQCFLVCKIIQPFKKNYVAVPNKVNCACVL